ncbi:MAG: hypothetical protein PF484_05055, partial [Bacteroidales bacterium]|nr:hypothetical protein [Bacteroidales bacterium]
MFKKISKLTIYIILSLIIITYTYSEDILMYKLEPFISNNKFNNPKEIKKLKFTSDEVTTEQTSFSLNLKNNIQKFECIYSWEINNYSNGFYSISSECLIDEKKKKLFYFYDFLEGQIEKEFGPSNNDVPLFASEDPGEKAAFWLFSGFAIELRFFSDKISEMNDEFDYKKTLKRERILLIIGHIQKDKPFF